MRTAELEAQVPVRDERGQVPPALRRIAHEAAKAEAELGWLASKPTLTQRDDRRRELQERRLDGYFDRLGMSVKSMLDYEPLRVQRQFAAQHTARPSRDPDHLRRTFGIVMAAGGLGPVAQEFARERDPEGELALFTDAERAEMAGPEAAPEEEPAAHVPEVAQLRVIRDGVDISKEEE